MMKTVLLLLLFAFPMDLSAQMRPTAKVEAMKKLDFLIGKWQGTSWIEMAPGQRMTIKAMETVESRLDGVILQVEGLHKARIPGREEEMVVHHAIGIFSYDEKANVYNFRTYLANGLAGEHKAKLTDGTLEWGYHDPRLGQVRYFIKLNEKGEWFETGERSQDGKAWQQFFEMTLQRVK